MRRLAIVSASVLLISLVACKDRGNKRPVETAPPPTATEVTPKAPQPAALPAPLSVPDVKKPPEVDVPPREEPDPARCSLPQVRGKCKAAFPNWWYNQETKACEQFIYGGCGGNDNRFKTAEECEAACDGK